MQALWIDTVGTFEQNDVKNYLKAPDMAEMMGGGMPAPGGANPLEAQAKAPTDAAALTEQIA